MRKFRFTVLVRMTEIYWCIRNLFARQSGAKRRILLIGSSNMTGRYLKTVVDIYRDDPDITLAATLNRSSIKKGYETGPFAEICEAAPINWLKAVFCHWDLMVFGSFSPAFYGNRACPKVFHGHGVVSMKPAVGSENTFPNDMVFFRGEPVFDSILAGGPLAKLELSKQMPRIAPTCDIAGDPIVDRLLEMQARRDEIRKELGFSEHEKVILSMSTWGPNSLFGHHGKGLIDTYRSFPDEYSFIVCIHPNNFSNYVARDIQEAADIVFRESDERIMVMHPDLPWEKQMVASDAGITDHSSIGLYYIQLYRPTIPAIVPDSGMPKESPFGRMLDICRTFSELDQVESAVNTALEDFDHEKLKELANQVIQPRGESSQVRKKLYDRLMKR